MSTQNSPVEEVRIGTVKAAIWRNPVGDDGNVRYGVTFGKLYRNDDGKWQTGRSFGLNDLLVLAKLADRVHTRIHELRAKSPEEDALRRPHGRRRLRPSPALSSLHHRRRRIQTRETAPWPRSSLKSPKPPKAATTRALGYGIFTQGETWDDLKEMVRDAVLCHFGDEDAPRVVRFHLVRQEAIAV